MVETDLPWLNFIKSFRKGPIDDKSRIGSDNGWVLHTTGENPLPELLVNPMSL